MKHSTFLNKKSTVAGELELVCCCRNNHMKFINLSDFLTFNLIRSLTTEIFD